MIKSQKKKSSGRGGKRAGAGRPKRAIAQIPKVKLPTGDLHLGWKDGQVIASVATGEAGRAMFWAAVGRMAERFCPGSAAEAITQLQWGYINGESEADLNTLAENACEEIFQQELVRLSIAACQGKDMSRMTVTQEKMAQTVSVSGLNL